MKTLKIRLVGFNNLFNNILSVNYAEDWEMIPMTKSDDENPLVKFKTKKWDKLLNLIMVWLEKNHTKEFSANPSKEDLVVGSLVEIRRSIECKIKYEWN